jgi:endoglucanase
MKRHLLLIISLFIIVSGQFSSAQTPFNRGVNLTGWFQTSAPRQIQFTKYTKKDFENIKSLGCDMIRLPINLFYMTNGKPDYKVDTLFYQFLDQAVSWAEELNIYLSIDNHSTDDVASKNTDLENVLAKVWAQMALHYKNRSTYILYEIMNEPNGLTTQTWGKIQQTAINAIRNVDTTHMIIVGASAFNGYNDLNLLPVYSDKKLIYTFHFYDPFLFTHQGASWANPSMEPLSKIPFPYNVDSMPAFPNALKGTWVESAYNNYNIDGTVAKVKQLIDVAATFKNNRNVNIYCGEYGVYIPNSKDTDRVYWYSEVRKYLEAKGISWTIWDYQGGFGLFKKGSNQQFDYDVNTSLVQALGLNVPPQKIFVSRPDSVGFNIYNDYIAPQITEASNANGGTIDFYSGQKPNNDKFCLFWTGSLQYGAIGFNFQPDKDLSKLVSQNYALSLMVRGNTPGTKIEVRFTDTKTTDPNDHPWRMNYTITESVAAWDGKWHKVYIPLKNFIDQGSYDNNTWYNPVGAFDWKAVDRFDIITDQGSLANKAFWFDNIAVTNMDTAKVYETSTFVLPVAVSGITVSSGNGTNTISTFRGTLQMQAAILPANATDKTITWSVNDTAIASINTSGLLAAKKDGSVIVTATANDGSKVKGSLTITITGQVKVSSIIISGAGGANSISTKGGTLQISPEILPANASDKTVTWSVSDTAKAAITTSGLLKAKKDGTITVTATSNDGSGVQGTLVISITGQSTATQDLKQVNSILIYPVPVCDGVLNVSQTSGNTLNITVFNAYGQLVLKRVTNDKFITLNVSSLLPGTYVVIASNKEKVLTKKFIIE